MTWLVDIFDTLLIMYNVLVKKYSNPCSPCKGSETQRP